MVVKLIAGRFLHQYFLTLPDAKRQVQFQVLSRYGWLLPILTEIKPEVLPETVEELALLQEAVKSRPTFIQAPTPHYHQYRCAKENPLSCHAPSEGSLSHCEQCSFPALLPEQGQLIGKQGQYQIGKPIGRRGIGRLYTGVQLGSEKPVTIQEYLLPARYFSQEEQQQYQEIFTSLAGLSLADGRVQDMRMVMPLEAIADTSGERCYSIAPAVDQSPTLNQYCAEHGAFGGRTVVALLNQVLQTLNCLHQQKFTLPSGQVAAGLVHGGISLDTLLWVENTEGISPPGFVYLTDFSLWEKLFDPASVNSSEASPQQDLSALGQVAFFLLNGATVDKNGQPLNPQLDNNWPERTYPPLKQFILRLLGIAPAFVNAQTARKALLLLPTAPIESQWEQRKADVVVVKKPWYKRYFPALATAAVLLTLGSGGWFLLRALRPTYAETLLPPCCLDDIAAVPTGRYTYSMPANAYWQPLLKINQDLFGAVPDSASDSASDSAPNSDAFTTTALSALPQTLFDQIQVRHPELSLAARAVPSVTDAIAHIQSGQADYAILPLTDEPLPPDVTATVIAYDALVPVVAFNYPNRVKGLPDALNGEIDLQQLKEIYTGNANYWDDIASTDLPIKRYWHNDPTLQQIFDTRVLHHDIEKASTRRSPTPQQSWLSNIQTNIRNPVAEERMPTITMLRWVLQDFENKNMGSIGIAPLSQVFGQCSVYPLAIKTDSASVSPLVFDDGSPIRPKSDLCDRKGSYQPNAEAMRDQDYPLSYPLAVVYPFDNTRSNIGQKLSDLLLTQESQEYLEAAGLVTAYPLP
ncbi:MAG: substrate-binding domain-containing protein [Cyanobacteria bacterium J06607_10]